MRFETTICDGHIIDQPHRIAATAGDGHEDMLNSCSTCDQSADHHDNQGVGEAAKDIAKQLLGRWYADSVLGS